MSSVVGSSGNTTSLIQQQRYQERLQKGNQPDPQLLAEAHQMVEAVADAVLQVCRQEVNAAMDKYVDSVKWQNDALQSSNNSSGKKHIFFYIVAGSDTYYLRMDTTNFNQNEIKKIDAKIAQMPLPERLFLKATYHVLLNKVSMLAANLLIPFQKLADAEGVSCITESLYVKYGLYSVISGKLTDSGIFKNPLLYFNVENFKRFPLKNEKGHELICKACR